MTRCPTTFESQAWATPSTPVTTAIAIRPRTRRVSRRSSSCGRASSKMSRIRNGETIPSSADVKMSPSTVASRQRYALKRSTTRCTLARRERPPASASVRPCPHGLKVPAAFPARPVGSARPAVVPFLLVRRPLGGRDGLEPLVRNRAAALDGEAVRPRSEPRLRALDGGDCLAELLREPRVQLVLVEVGGLVGGLVLVGELAGVLAPQAGESALDALALPREQLAGAVGIHGADRSEGVALSGAVLIPLDQCVRNSRSSYVEASASASCERPCALDRMKRGPTATDPQLIRFIRRSQGRRSCPWTCLLAHLLAHQGEIPCRSAFSDRASKPVRRGSPTLGRFDSCAAPFDEVPGVLRFD